MTEHYAESRGGCGGEKLGKEIKEERGVSKLMHMQVNEFSQHRRAEAESRKTTWTQMEEASSTHCIQACLGIS